MHGEPFVAELNVCVYVATGGDCGPVPETCARGERTLPQQPEAEHQPSDGGGQALESPAEAPYPREGRLGTQVLHLSSSPHSYQVCLQLNPSVHSPQP